MPTLNKSRVNSVLKLYGDIGELQGMDAIFGDPESMVSAKTVSEFLDNNKDATHLTVRINSRGGDVQEGWAIHDLLVNSGKQIKTVGEGKIYSIATIVFLAGSEREIMKNADGLIHNPFIPPFTLADSYESDDLLKIAEGLKQEEEKILDFYVQRTGSPRDKLAGYMAEDTKLSAQDMLDLGFATKIIEPVLAFALYNPKTIIKMNENDVKTLGQKLDSIMEKIKNFSRVPPKDQTLTDKDGKEFKLEKESGAPAVGDVASPDGSFTMADGKVIVIAGGKITEIREPQQNSELDQAKALIEQQKTQIAELQQKIADAEKEKIDNTAAAAELKQKTDAVVALHTELSELKNSWKPGGRTKFSTAEKVGDVDLTRVREMNKKVLNLKEEK